MKILLKEGKKKKKKMKLVILNYAFFIFIIINTNENESVCVEKRNCIKKKDVTFYPTGSQSYTIIKNETGESMDTCCERCWELSPKCTVFKFLEFEHKCILYGNISYTDLHLFDCNGTCFGAPLTPDNTPYYYYYYY
jgi:hypothetical protein